MSCELPNDILPTIFYFCYNNDFKSIIKFSEINKLTNEIASEHLQEIKKIYLNLHYLKVDFTPSYSLNDLIENSNCNNGIGIKFNGRIIEFYPIKLENFTYAIVDPMSGTIQKGTNIDKAENYDYDFTIKVIAPKLELNTSKANLLVNKIKNMNYAIELVNMNYAIELVNISPKEEKKVEEENIKEEKKVEEENIIYSLWNKLFGNK